MVGEWVTPAGACCELGKWGLVVVVDVQETADGAVRQGFPADVDGEWGIVVAAGVGEVGSGWGTDAAGFG